MAYKIKRKKDLSISPYTSMPKSIYVTEDAKKYYPKGKLFIVKESGFVANYQKARTSQEALIKQIKESGTYGGNISISVEK